MLKSKDELAAGLQQLPDTDLATLKSELKTDDQKSDGNQHDAKHPDGSGGKTDEEISKLKEELETAKKRLRDQQSFYQRKENELSRQVESFKDQLEKVRTEFNSMQSDKTSTRAQEIDKEISNVKSLIREADDVERAELQARLVDLTVEKRDALKSAQEMRAKNAEKTIEEAAQKQTLAWLTEIAQAAHGGELTQQDLDEYRDIATQKKLPTFVNAIFEKKIGEVAAERDELKSKYENQEKEYSQLKTTVSKLLKKRGLLTEETTTLNMGPTSRPGGGTVTDNSGTTPTRVRGNIAQRGRAKLVSDPELMAALQQDIDAHR